MSESVFTPKAGHWLCKSNAQRALQQMSRELHMLKDMAHDGCTVGAYMDALNAIEEAIGTIRRGMVTQ